MRDSKVTRRKLAGMSCVVGALNFLFLTVGCDSDGGSDAGSGGAAVQSGGGPGSGGSSTGGSENGASGGASSGAAPGAGGSSGGGTSSGGSGEAAGGQGGAHMNDPLCPAEQPTHEETCSVSWIPFCSYGETNCACYARQWDCVGCPSEFVLNLDGEDCTGYEGEACRSCECPAGPEPKWDCSEDYWQTRACSSGTGIVQVAHNGERGCLIVMFATEPSLCIGEVMGDGYCVIAARMTEGVSCREVTGDDGPKWEAQSVTGSLAVAGTEEAPIVTLDVTIEYDPESWPIGDPPPNDVIKIESCAADCSAAGCQ
jgi:hypothetical protein